MIESLGTWVGIAATVFSAGMAIGVLRVIPNEMRAMETRINVSIDKVESALKRLPSLDALEALRRDVERHEAEIAALRRHLGDVREELAEVRSGGSKR